MMLKYMEEQLNFVYINYLYRICNVSSLLPFYVYLPTGVRLTSEFEVLCYMDEGEIPESVNGDCDTSTKHNVRED
jgi:hypothetical protein